MDSTLKTLVILFIITLIAFVGFLVGSNLRSDQINDSSVSDTLNLKCYRCTNNLNDGDLCEEFVFQATSCPTGTSSSPTGCALAVGGSCPTSENSLNLLTCYRCTQSLNDGEECESFQTSSPSCPSGSSVLQNGCAKASGGSCPQIITCYKCTAQTNDANACEPFIVEGGICPIGSSTNPNGCAQSIGGLCPINPVVCGPIDVNSDGKITSLDLAQFSLFFGKFCSDSPYIPTSLPSCGGKDTNGDGRIDASDLNSLNSRFNAVNCYI